MKKDEFERLAAVSTRIAKRLANSDAAKQAAAAVDRLLPLMPRNMRAAAAGWELKMLEGRFDETGNPLYLWRALRLVGEHSLQWPSWLARALVSLADQMEPLEQAGGRFPHDALKRATGFAKAQVSEVKNYDVQRSIWLRTLELVEGDDSLPLQDAFATVAAEFNRSPRTVEKYWYRFGGDDDPSSCAAHNEGDNG